MAVERGNHQLRRLLEAVQRLVRVQAKVIFELRRNAGQHLDVRARRKKLFARPTQDEDMDGIVHARLEDGSVELLHHLVGVGVGRRVVYLDPGQPLVGGVMDERPSGGGGGCRSHEDLLDKFSLLASWTGG